MSAKNLAKQLGNHPCLPPLLTTLCALAVYLITLAPDITWANFGTDGGELITAAVTLGVPHPPGYPTYVLLGKLFSLLPLGTVAYRLHLFSAVCLAGAAGLVTATLNNNKAKHKKQSQAAAIAAGLCLAFAPLVWGQALIAEVYGLNLLVVAALMWALWSKRPSLLTGSLFGLSLTTHPTSLLLLPLALALTPRQQWPKFALAIPIGLLPLLAIPLLAQSGSPVVWGRPDSWAGWWWLVTGNLYRHNLLSAEWQSRLLPFSQTLLSQFTWVTLPLLLAALASYSFASASASASASAVRQLRLPVLPLLATILLYFFYALTYNVYDAIVYLLPAVLLLALLLERPLRQLGVVALLLPLALLLLNFNEQNLRKDQAIRPSATQRLQTAPTDAILLMSGEGVLFTLWYFQQVEGMRPDLILVDENLFAFDWHRQQLQVRYPDVRWPDAYDLDALRVGQERPFCQLTQLQKIECYE